MRPDAPTLLAFLVVLYAVLQIVLAGMGRRAARAAEPTCACREWHPDTIHA